MSSARVKRLLRLENLKGTGKKSKRQKLSASDDEDSRASNPRMWVPKTVGDLRSSHIYNSTSRSPPAELFRKDLISAMKLADNEPLDPDSYWFISDQWKPEWERGVQVPVNPDALPVPSVRVKRKTNTDGDFKLPKKFIRITHDDFFSSELHQMSNAPAQAEKVCRYDLDNCDAHWLTIVNHNRKEMGLKSISELDMEMTIQELEMQCHDNVRSAIQTEEGLGIEYDEDVICDVCRSPDSEEGNEMVFCDSCDICVHQACYGITRIPEGSWLCKTCKLGIKPQCILCPNKGGAMKSTKCDDTQKWAHVSCALWIPEVSIGCVEKMEPITKLSHIPPSRWALVCCLCRDRSGACIQCTVKTCKTAYHVTCAFGKGLHMKVIVDDDVDDDGVKLKSYCPKHSKNRDRPNAGELEGADSKTNSQKKEISMEDKANEREKRLQQIQSEFYKYVDVNVVSESLELDKDSVESVYHYWKLKRRAAYDRPLLAPRVSEMDNMVNEKEDTLYARMKMFVRLRQDLERVRNLCYMVSRREKITRTWYRYREQVFHKQNAELVNGGTEMSETERNLVVHAAHSDSVYDRLSASGMSCCLEADGRRKPMAPELEGNPLAAVFWPPPPVLPQARNGMRGSSDKLPNPYAKRYLINGVRNRLNRHSKTGCEDGEEKSNAKNDGEEEGQEDENEDVDEDDTDHAAEDDDYEPSKPKGSRVKDGDESGTQRTRDGNEVSKGRARVLGAREKLRGMAAASARRRSAEGKKLNKAKFEEQRQTTKALLSQTDTPALTGYRIPKKAKAEPKCEPKCEPIVVDPVPVAVPVSETAPEDPRTITPRPPPQERRMTRSDVHRELLVIPPLLPPPPPPPSLQALAMSPLANSTDGIFSNDGDSDPQRSPRLVIKLRKDPNYPDAPSRWRRDNDASVYDFNCDPPEAPPPMMHPGRQMRVTGPMRHPSSSAILVHQKYSMRPRVMHDQMIHHGNSYGYY